MFGKNSPILCKILKMLPQYIDHDISVALKSRKSFLLSKYFLSLVYLAPRATHPDGGGGQESGLMGPIFHILFLWSFCTKHIKKSAIHLWRSIRRKLLT